MTRSLQGTVALVTGSSSGIGSATARRLAADGAAVALVARRRDLLDDLASTIRSDGGSALVLQADVTDKGRAGDALERTVSDLGRLDTVVNNAGIMLLGPALDAPTEEWDRMVALNVHGLLYVTHAAFPHLVQAAQVGPRHVAGVATDRPAWSSGVLKRARRDFSAGSSSGKRGCFACERVENLLLPPMQSGVNRNTPYWGDEEHGTGEGHDHH